MCNRLAAWVREEVRLLSLDTWENEYDIQPCTSQDPRCQKTLERLREVSERMRRMRSRMLDGKPLTCSASTDVRATIVKAMQ